MVRLERPGLLWRVVKRQHGQCVCTSLRLNKLDLTDVFGFQVKHKIMIWLWNSDDLEMCTSDSERYSHALSEWLNNQLCSTNMTLVSGEKERRITRTIYIEISQEEMKPAVAWISNSIMFPGGRAILMTEENGNELLKMTHCYILLVLSCCHEGSSLLVMNL